MKNARLFARGLLLRWLPLTPNRVLTRVIFSRRFVAYTVFCCLIVGASRVVSGQAVTTHFNDPHRTGTNPSETTLTTSNVNVDSFGKLFSRSVDGQIYAQPLYVPALDIPGRGVHNVVFVATEHNSVYAYDADTPSESTPLWQANLGPSVPIAVLNISDDIIQEIGVTGPPVIDVTTNTIYVVAHTYAGGVVSFRLHALDIKTGLARAGSPVVIAGSVPGTASDSVSGVLTFDARTALQRPGLLLLNGRIYIGFGSHNDLQPYHGWLFGYNAATLQRTAVQSLTPNGQGAGIWQGGVGLAADTAGNIYVQTGHAEQVTAGISYGNSLVKLSTPNLTIVDYFSPSNRNALDQFDIDYGASGPILIPGTTFVVGGGKDGRMFLNNTNNLGQFHPVNQVLQEWQATNSALTGPGGLFARNVYYNSTLYLWGRFDTLKAFRFQGSLFNTTPISQSTFNVPDGYSNEPGMSISANGTSPGTGILWAAYSSTGASNGGAFPGVLSAFDASDLTRELWNSNQNAARDYSGSWAKWSPPTVANGKVYLASFDNVLNVFGLITVAPAASVTATAGTPQSTTINAPFATALKATVRNASSTPMPGVQVTFTAPASGPSGSFGGASSVSAMTDSSGVATAPTLTANSTAGSHAVTATTAGVATPATFSLTNTAASGGGSGSLAGAVTMSTAAVNVATEGSADWVHWNTAGLTRKAGVAAQLSSYTMVGTGPVLTYLDDLRLISWTGGTPTASGTNSKEGVYIRAVGNGFSFTAPADTSSRQLIVHVGGYLSGGRLLAHLSDGSAVDYSDTSATDTNVNDNYDRNYTLTYKAATAGQTLTVTWVMTSGTGNVSLSAAALSVVGASGSIVATAGTPQSAAINTAFATAFKATVRNASNAPVSGVSVTFTVPASGASGRFSGLASVAATTDSGGVATAPAFTANGTTGSYVVTATTAGVATPATFSLTNTAGAVASVTATAGTPQGTTINTPFATALKATVRNASSTPMPGVQVTFTAPASGPSGSFGGASSVSAMTDSSGVATAPTLTANSTAGSHAVTATTAGVATPATFSLTNTAASGGGSGSLAGAVTMSTAAVNVATEGSADWVHWNTAGLTRKAGVAAQLSSYTMVGTGPVLTYFDDLRLISWTGGTPTASGTNSKEGVYIRAVGNGFSFTAPADTSSRQLIVHVGGYLSGGRLLAHLSDGSAVDYSDTSATDTNVNDNYDRNYTLTYKAATAGQTLTVTWVMTSGTGNVSLSAAALSVVGASGSIVATAGTPQSAAINTAFATALKATVRDASNAPVSGVLVTFTVPASGASGRFSGLASVAVVTDSSGVATAPAFTANGTTGIYAVMASTAGVATPATFSLTNTAASGGGSGSLAGAVTTSTATVNVATEGSADWVHWSTTGLTRKAGVAAQLSSYTMVGTGPVLTYFDDLRLISWTGGTPTASGTNSKEGVYIRAVGNGFSFTAPAETISRRLIVHVGGYLSGGRLTAHLSDGSAVDYSDTAATATNVNDNYDRNYTLTYKAASAGQTLTVMWIMTSGTGNVSLSAAALSLASGP